MPSLSPAIPTRLSLSPAIPTRFVTYRQRFLPNQHYRQRFLPDCRYRQRFLPDCRYRQRFLPNPHIHVKLPQRARRRHCMLVGYHNFLGKANFLGSQEVFFLRMRHFQDIFCGIFSECGTFGKSESRNISESHIKTSWEKSMFSQEVCPKK